MKNKTLSKLCAASAALALGLVQAYATEVTIPDPNPGAGFGGGPFGFAAEDNETEPGTTPGQIWDLEAFVVAKVLGVNTLYMIGGFNFSLGEAGYLPGDLFIKVGGGAPPFGPLTSPAPVTEPNSTYSYTYAVDLGGPLAASASRTVNILAPDSDLNTVVNDSLRSNPLDVAALGSGTTVLGGTTVAYASGLSDAAVLAGYGVSLVGGTHNVVTIDLSFMGALDANEVYWLSYTMQCGNDMMKGAFKGDFTRIPDGGLSLMLLGLGLGAIGMIRRRTA